MNRPLLSLVGCVKVPAPVSEVPVPDSTGSAEAETETETETETDNTESMTGEEETLPVTEWQRIPSGIYAVLDDGWVYYASTSKSGLFKMREDGTESQQLSSDYPIYHIKVYDGWVYYLSPPKVGDNYLDDNLET